MYNKDKIRKIIPSSELSRYYKEEPKASSGLSSEQVSEIIKKLIESNIEEIEKYKKETDKQIKDQKVEIKKLKEETRTIKIDFIAVIGIFVSIFTFISIEIQILRYVCDFWRIAGFSLIIFGSLSSFVILVHSIFSQKEIKNKILAFCVAIFLLGIFVGSVPHIFNINNSCIISTTDNPDVKNILEIKISDELKNSEVQDEIESQNNDSNAK